MLNPVPPDFAGIALNNCLSGPCSPDLADEAVGLVIRGPQAVFLQEEMVLPVCGSYRFPAPFWNRFRSLRYEMALVAVDAATHRPLITNLRYRDFEPTSQRMDETEDGFAETLIGGWFNADLCFYIEGFPRRPATYHIFALIGPERSNVIAVEVRKP
jgi:hypothetical protein